MPKLGMSTHGGVRPAADNGILKREAPAATLIREPLETNRVGKEQVLIVLFTTLLAAGLGVLLLGRKSLWLDEVFSVFAAKLDWAHLWSLASTTQANMSFYYVLLHLWINLGDSEFVVRCLSLVAAVGTVPVFYLLSRRLFGSTVAAVASFLLAINAFFITSAQEARGYSLVLLLVTISSYEFVRGIEQPSRWSWIVYVLASVLAVYTHLFAVFVPLAHLVSLPFLKPRRVSVRALVASFGSIGVFASPLALFVLTRDVGQIDWISRPSLTSLVGAFQSLAGRGGRLLLVSYFLICCVAVVAGLRKTSRGTDPADRKWRAAFVLTWLFTPILVSFAFSVAIKPIFLPRYLIVSLPPLVLLAAVGIVNLSRRRLQVGVALLLTLLSGRALVSVYAHETEDWRAVTGFVVGETHDDDGIVFVAPYVRAPFEYYVNRFQAVGRAPDPFYPGGNWTSNSLLEPEAPDEAAALGTLTASRYERVWLVLSHEGATSREREENRSIEASLERVYVRLMDRRFAGVRVLLYERRA